MGLQGFERRLEQLVEGTFGKAFPSGLQPVEVGRKVTRTLDADRTVGVDGVPIAPNNIGVYLASQDFDRFQDFADTAAAIQALQSLGDERPVSQEGVVEVGVRRRSGAIADAVGRLIAAGVGVEDISLRRATLDDVFLALTGHAAERGGEDETG